MPVVKRSGERLGSTYGILRTVGLLFFVTAVGNDDYSWCLLGLGLFVMGLFGPVRGGVILSARFDRIVYVVAALVVIPVGVAELVMAVLEVVEILIG